MENLGKILETRTHSHTLFNKTSLVIFFGGREGALHRGRREGELLLLLSLFFAIVLLD